MVNLLAPVVTTGPTYIKVANFPGLYRHARSGRYYACKKLNGIRRERSLQTSDRKIAERRLKEWIGNMDKVDTEVEKTTIGQLIQRFVVVTGGMAHNTHVTNNAIINEFLRWWPHGRDYQVRLIRPSSLDEWLALQEPVLKCQASTTVCAACARSRCRGGRKGESNSVFAVSATVVEYRERAAMSAL